MIYIPHYISGWGRVQVGTLKSEKLHLKCTLIPLSLLSQFNWKKKRKKDSQNQAVAWINCTSYVLVTWSAFWGCHNRAGEGFSLLCEDLGRMFHNLFPAGAFFFFLTMEISLRTLIPIFMPQSVHSGSLSWDDCGLLFPDKLIVSSFLERFPHYAWTVAYLAHSDFIESRVRACLGVTSHLHF